MIKTEPVALQRSERILQNLRQFCLGYERKKREDWFKLLGHVVEAYLREGQLEKNNLDDNLFIFLSQLWHQIDKADQRDESVDNINTLLLQYIDQIDGKEQIARAATSKSRRPRFQVDQVGRYYQSSSGAKFRYEVGDEIGRKKAEKLAQGKRKAPEVSQEESEQPAEAVEEEPMPNLTQNKNKRARKEIVPEEKEASVENENESEIECEDD